MSSMMPPAAIFETMLAGLVATQRQMSRKTHTLRAHAVLGATSDDFEAKAASKPH
jgi:hypothetical protein